MTKAGVLTLQKLVAGNITWAMVVTNHGTDATTGVTIADLMPVGNTCASAAATQESCRGGATLHCSLGTVAAGGAVTLAGNQTETNYANNIAASSVEADVETPPVFYVVEGRDLGLHPHGQQELQHHAGGRDHRLHSTGDRLSG